MYYLISAAVLAVLVAPIVGIDYALLSNVADAVAMVAK
jgi:hypothetical protein